MFLDKRFKIFFLFYLPILVWMGLIFYLSSIPGLKIGASMPMELILRKIAHLLEYAFLTWLFFRNFNRIFSKKYFKVSIFSFVCVLLFSSSDEFHQFFVQERSGNFIDVGIDCVGIMIGLFISIKLAGIISDRKK